MTAPTRRKPKCGMADRYSDRRCPHDGAHRVILGCVHEHMTPGFVCARHVTAVREQDSITCGPCGKGRGAHECVLIGREVTLAEAKAFMETRRSGA